MATKLYPIVRKIALSQYSRLKYLRFEKVSMHQDDIKNLNDLTLRDMLNLECDSIEKI